MRKLIRKLVPGWALPLGHWAEAVVYNWRYGFPAKGMKVIGVTGTNGKTTTSFLIHRMLTEAGYKTGLMTTVAWAVDGEIRPQHEHMTNVPVPLLMRRLKEMQAAGVEWLVLETTSHALVQHRTWGVPYSVAVLTNITQDHLDYHKTMANYVAAKKRLFQLTQANKQGLQVGITNADDPHGAEFAGVTRRSVLYGIDAGDVRARGVQLKRNGISYDVEVEGEGYTIVSRLVGKFNVYNTLAAVSVGWALGLSGDQIVKGIAALEGVAGRMERIDEGQWFEVVVDYAHTPDALENVLSALRESTKGKLAVVFGATGDRDKTKRPIMGEVAARLADKIYLTDDETYTEDPAAIRQAVLAGIEKAGGKEKTAVVDERSAAIRRAFEEAQPGDTVLLAGIGHQDSRNMGGELLPWDERKVARVIIKEVLALRP